MEAFGAIAGGLLGGDDEQSTQTQTQQREPWAAAQPWLQNNLALGQQLQNQYMDNPFSPQQQSAFSNAFGMSDAYRSILPQLIGGINQGQFDRRNPLQRPQAFNFSGFNPQTSQMGAFRPTSLAQQARAAVVPMVPMPIAATMQSAPVRDYEFGNSEGGFGNSDDGGTWA